MEQSYTPVMWDDKRFAFVPYEAFGDLPHYPKEKCEQICKELNSLIRLCTYRPKKEDGVDNCSKCKHYYIQHDNCTMQCHWLGKRITPRKKIGRAHV